MEMLILVYDKTSSSYGYKIYNILYNTHAYTVHAVYTNIYNTYALT